MRAVGLMGPLILFLSLAALASGCGGYGAVAPEGADTVSVALTGTVPGADSILARLYLYRIKSRKTHKRLGIGRSFTIREGRQVRAVLEMEGLDGDEHLLIHIMWINPDGRRAYTKEVHILPGDWDSEEKVQQLRKMRVRLDRARHLLEVESRYGVDPVKFEEEMDKPPEKRTFKPGRWEVRVYLFRKLLLATSFDLAEED
ncbi:MAG: hypothetical protein N2V73_00075 [Candidatus Methanospirare jalkutatii]|nr:hypothetical protein [Candidatus Methanospirare jalkutatii]